jgi:hypothetical protein
MRRSRRTTGFSQMALPLTVRCEKTEPMTPEIEHELITLLTLLLRNAAQARRSAGGRRDEDR